MSSVGRTSLAASVGLLGISAVLGWVASRPAVNATAVQQMSVSTAFFDSTIVLARHAQPRGVRGDELAVALGYLERLRLGIEGPFRLAHDALLDPRLGMAMSPRVAWAILGRLQRGDAYVLDSAVLDGVGPWASDGRGAAGAAHLVLIDRAVAEASDPRAGELAVRLAYMIEAAKGAIASSSVTVAAQVAALARDRALATRDLETLLSDATDEPQNDVLALLKRRRMSRGFEAERPGLAPLPPAVQIDAMNAVPALVAALDTLDRATARPRQARATAPVLGRFFAARLLDLGGARPPSAQVLVSLRSHGSGSLNATNEETLAAAYDAWSATPRPDSARRAPALALVASAVAARALAQELPWFPGDPGGDQAELASEFGLAAVSFGRGVPAAWQPYYLRQLQSGLSDVRSVLPASSFKGLHVRFVADALRDSALAMHDPRDRTLYLPIATAAGTIAHELSHDLDWQTARRLFADASGYSSDRAMRDRSGPLASSLRGLADTRAQHAYSGASPVDRPTELLARGMDWFVASALARQGRTNGFLSGIEDGVLAGYAAGAPSALGSAGASSLVSAIGAMTYLPDSVRLEFESQWSDPLEVDPALLVRRALEAPISWRTVSAWRTTRSLGPLAPIACGGDRSADARARESLLMLAIDARARGMAARRARARAATERAPWALGLLGVPPWSHDAGERMIDGLRSAILAELGSALADQGVLPLVPPLFRSSASPCAGAR